MIAELIPYAYLLAAVLFLLGLRQLGSPKTASRGNLTAAVGMLIAIVATLVDQGIVSYGVIVAAWWWAPASERCSRRASR